MREVSSSLKENKAYFDGSLQINQSFDLINRPLQIGGRDAVLYFINGFCKEDLMQKILQYFLGLKAEEMPQDAENMIRTLVPHVEVSVSGDWDFLTHNLLSGLVVIFIDGYTEGIILDARDYPARSVDEPDKDKVLRGSKDGFVETVLQNTALIRRRIRSTDLHLEILNAGKSSETDIVLCYMNSRVDHDFLEEIRKRITNIQVDALTLNQESLAECIYHRRWYNPFPKFKFTERPDTASAQILEGDIVILVDNSPSAMILPTSIFDMLEEADDYYFPPITGSYLRITRFLIALMTYFLTPTFLLFTMYPQWLPAGFSFILVQDTVNIPLLAQFLLLELAIDGLKLAAINTPNMLSTPLSVMAALVLGEFSVNSGWFNAEVMLYMAFVAIANYTQNSYEFGYAMKFMRIITLITTSFLGIWGYIGGITFTFCCLLFNKTIAGRSYLYPLIPFDGNMLWKRLIRRRLPGSYPPPDPDINNH